MKLRRNRSRIQKQQGPHVFKKAYRLNYRKKQSPKTLSELPPSVWLLSADYGHQTEQTYKGNPLIEALPPSLS